MSLAGCQFNSTDVNFYQQKLLEIFDKNSDDKIQFKNYKEVNPPCLMPIRVKYAFFSLKKYKFKNSELLNTYFLINRNHFILVMGKSSAGMYAI